MKGNIPVRKAFAALLHCRTGKLGGVQWQCYGRGRDPMVYDPPVHYLISGGGVTTDSAGHAQEWQQTLRNFLVHHGTLIKRS
jgi:hypothetical protein